MNLICYDEDDAPLFARHCKNKSDARKAIVFGYELARIVYVIFKNKRYEIKEVYGW